MSGSATAPFQRRINETLDTLERIRDDNPFELARQTVAQRDSWKAETQQADAERDRRRSSMKQQIDARQILKGLENPRSQVREQAVERLELMPEVEVPADILCSLLQDTSWGVRSWAMGRLKERSDDTVLFITKVVPLLSHSDESVRESVLDVLLEAKPEVLHHIPGAKMGELLQESSYTVRTSTASLLTKLVKLDPTLHMKEMAVLLQHENTNVRDTAVEVLQSLEEHWHLIPAQIIGPLLQDTSLNVNIFAAQWFKSQGRNAYQHVGNLLIMLQAASSQTREMAVGVLKDMGEEVNEFLPPEILAMCLTDTSWTVRSWAIEAFGAKKGQAASHARHVLPLLQRCDTMGRESAVEALQAMNLELATAGAVGPDVLVKLLQDSSAWVRAFAVQAFQAQGEHAGQFADKVLPLLKADISSTRESAAEVVTNMGESTWRKVPEEFWVSLTKDISGVVQELARSALNAQGKGWTY